MARSAATPSARRARGPTHAAVGAAPPSALGSVGIGLHLDASEPMVPRARRRDTLSAMDGFESDGFEPKGSTGTELRGVLTQIRFQRDGFLIGVLQDGTAVKGALGRPEIGLEYTFEG